MMITETQSASVPILSLPLKEAIELDFQEREFNNFINECEGHCGL